MDLDARPRPWRAVLPAMTALVAAVAVAACAPPTPTPSTTSTTTVAGGSTTTTTSTPGGSSTTTTTAVPSGTWKLTKRTAEASTAPSATPVRTLIEVAAGYQATLLASTNGGQNRVELARLPGGVPTAAATLDVGAVGDKVEDIGMGDGVVAVLLARPGGTQRSVVVLRRTGTDVWAVAGTVAFTSTNVGGGTAETLGSVVIGDGRLVVGETTRGAALNGTVRAWDVSPGATPLVTAGPVTLAAPAGTNELGLLTWGGSIDLDGGVLAVAESGGGQGIGSLSHVAVFTKAASGFGAPVVVPAGRSETDLPKVAVDVTGGVTRLAITETGATVTSLVRLLRRDGSTWTSEAAFAVTSSAGATAFNFGVALDLDAGLLVYNDGLALRYPNPGSSTSIRIRRQGPTGWPVQKSYDPYVAVNGTANDTAAVVQLSVSGADVAAVALRLPAGSGDGAPGYIRTDTYHYG